MRQKLIVIVTTSAQFNDEVNGTVPVPVDLSLTES
jgi:hypothetical protein